MKILLYLSRFPGYGGIETVTEIIGNRLADMGHQVSLLTHVSQDRESKLLSKVHYYLMPDINKWDTDKNSSYAEEIVKNNDFDVIIFQDSYAPIERIAVLMKRLLKNGGRLLVFEHSTPLYIQEYFKSRRSFLKSLYINLYLKSKLINNNKQRHLFLLRHADAYIVLAKKHKEELVNLCGYEAVKDYINKILYINNPIILVNYELDFSNKENIILFVGQITKNKRVGLMLDIWKMISNQYSDWRFLVVGDGPLYSQLVKRVHNEHIERVTFCGYQKPDTYYKKAKIFWMTSSFEGWPLTLLESMNYGCVPVVMESFSSVRDIVDNEEDGYIVPNCDTNAFANASYKIMDDTNYRRLAKGAQAKTKQFDVNIIIKEWERLLDNKSDIDSDQTI